MRRMVTVYNRNRPKFERIKVTALYGDLTLSNSSIVDSHIVVCTIEKANFIANSLISMKIQGSLGCVVIDEFHSLGQVSLSFRGVMKLLLYIVGVLFQGVCGTLDSSDVLLSHPLMFHVA